MKLIGRLLSVVIVLGALAALCLPADAGAYLYAGKRKKVYCGIVGLERTDSAGNTEYINQDAIDSVTDRVAPSFRCNSLFAKLDGLNSMKPSGWTFENPLAATQDKYDLRYWVVTIKSARNLTRLNVLYFPVASGTYLTDEERENLRQFVDGGGVLWVDNTSASTLDFASGPFFISQLSFRTGASGADAAVSRHHPLLCSPNWLTEGDIVNLGMNADSGWSRCYCDMGSTDVPTSEPTSFDILFPIVDSSDNSGALGGQPSVVANTYGSGRVVATANAVGRSCMFNGLASLKFAFNIMAYASSWTDIRKNPRHTGSSIDTLSSNTLVQKWWLELPPPGAGREYAPLIYKNTVFYTSGSTLYALDQNGDTHGGMWPRGSGGEVVIWTWNAPGGGMLSAPSIATVQNPVSSNIGTNDCRPIEAILVMNEAGTVFVLNAFPINPDNTIQPIAPPWPYRMDTAAGVSGVGSMWPSPPIYVNGWIYALGGDGRLYAENPCLRKLPDTNPKVVWQWQCPDPAYASTPKCGPSFGYMKNLDSGAIVGMVYWFDSPNTATPTIGDINDHICGVPISVSMDRISAGKYTFPDPNDRQTVNIQPTYFGRITLSDPRDIRILNTVGTNIVTQATVIPNMYGARDGISVTTSEQVGSNPLIYASYAISYGTGITPRPLDMEIEPRSAQGPVSHSRTFINGTPAMGPDNMIYLTGSPEIPGPSGGSILAYQNDGRAGSSGKLKWHYFLHSGVSDPSYMPGIDVLLPGVVQCPIPLDPTQDTQPMLDPQPSSSPAVAGGKVFVTVSGHAIRSDGVEVPTGALLCLKANPEFVIRITESSGYDAFGRPIKQPKSLLRKTDQGHYNVKVWQPNLINAINPAGGPVPLMDARPVGDGINVDYATGTITFTDFSRTKLQSLMVETNTFSPSLPVWVWLDNVEVPIDWSTWGPGWMNLGSPAVASSDSVDLSGWNNLLWYYYVPSNVHSPPVVIGTTVYFVSDDGILYALDTETGESTSRETRQTPDWHPQVGGGTIPQNAAVSVAGSNGVLMVPGPDGLHAFTDTKTLVADNNRVVEVDGAGEVTWAVDSISWPATSASMAMRQGPVNKPSRARYASTGEILFANSGANQVCLIDKGGNVGYALFGGLYQRSVYDKFADPKHLLRPGQPTQLRSPTDAIMWQDDELVASGSVAVVHCLIADSGNSRILDLVYRIYSKIASGKIVDKWFVDHDNTRIDPGDAEYIDADSGFVMPELNWVSKTDSLNERYAFDCLQKVWVMRDGKSCEDIWVASSNYASTGTNLGGDSPKGSAGLGGAILAIGYREQTLGTSTTPAGNWSYNATTSGTITARCDHISLNDKVVPLANPRFFDTLVDPDTGLLTGLLICDNYGVYEVTVGDPIPTVVAHLLEAEYRSIPRKREKGPGAPSSETPESAPIDVPLMATSVQLLPNRNLLITNSYSGSDKSGAMKFGGEVFELNAHPSTPDDVIPWSSPRLQQIWDTNAGVWAGWKQITANTYNLRQPKSAFR